MSEMIERVARALCRQYMLDDGYADRDAASAAEAPDGMWRNFRDAARAAIDIQTGQEVAAKRLNCYQLQYPNCFNQLLLQLHLSSVVDNP